MRTYVNLYGILWESLSNGPGVRRVFFAQGCSHHCRGCHNPDSWSFDGGVKHNIISLIEEVMSAPYLKGITFSGGEPFDQPREFAYLGKVFRELGLNVWCYSGYTLEEIMLNSERRLLLENIDVLVDGPFEKDKALDGLRFRGSTNQRIIDVPKTLELGILILLPQV